MSTRNQQACVWAGAAALVFWAVGFSIAGFITPPDPGDSASQIAEMYQDDRNAIRTGLMLIMFGSALFGPFIAVISVQMRRIEGASPALTYTQLALGAILLLEFIVPAMMLQTAAFRADRSDESIQLLNDLGWLTFVGSVSTAVVQQVVIGAIILQDKRPDPIFPRWSGYLNIWTGSILILGGFIVYFHDGPFRWNGLFPWWVGIVDYGTWCVVMTVLLLRAARRQAQEPTAESDASDRSELSALQKVELLSAEVESLRRELSRPPATSAGG